MNRIKGLNRFLPFTLLIGLAIGGLYASSLYSYLLFHTLVEIFTVIVMGSIFFLAWNTRQWMENNYFLFIGIAFLFVGLIELIHALAYRGMNIFVGYEANLPTQLWILGRYLLSTSLLTAPVWLNRRLPVWPVMAAFFVVTVISLSLIFTGNFPICYVEGTGLTDFKIYSEYAIILILGSAMALLIKNRNRFDSRVLGAMVAFLTLSIGAEMAFTTYLGVYDVANLVGHILMLLSNYFLYSAMIQTGLQYPFDLVFRDLKLKEKELLRSESDLQRLFDISPFPVVITSLSDSSFIKVNQAAMDIFELNSADLAHFRGIDFYANPEDRLKLLEILQKDRKVQQVLLELKSKSGRRIWCLINGATIELNGEVGLLVAMADITELRQTQEELRYLSTHDALTGIYNRNYFETEIERLQKGRRFPVGIIMLDMDELKEINDTYGHVQGDKQLQTAASLVKGVLRAEEVFARFGGDEFAILLPYADEKTAQQVVSRINAKIIQYNSKNGNLPLKISIGVGTANEKEDLHEAVKCADENMYADKISRKRSSQSRK